MRLGKQAIMSIDRYLRLIVRSPAGQERSGSDRVLVAVPGALLSIGDGHAAQGDGEVAGTAIECGCPTRAFAAFRRDWLFDCRLLEDLRASELRACRWEGLPDPPETQACVTQGIIWFTMLISAAHLACRFLESDMAQKIMDRI
jgi:Acetamidase/Formamidase family